MPRTKCPEHGVKRIEVPWARPGSDFTLLFKHAAMSLVKEMPVLAVSRQIRAQCDFKPMQPGDVPRTWANTEALFQATGHRPQVGVEEGVQRFVAWYRWFVL